MHHDDVATPPAAPLQPRGSRQRGLREYNERVVLQAIRLHGNLPAAEIARLTRLTAQTVSTITKRLLDDALLRKGAPQRGKVGQPSVPLALNPDGAYAVGIKVGRRSVDVLLVDFTGAVRERWSTDYTHPHPQRLRDAIGARLDALASMLGPTGSDRVQGVGIAAPLSLGGWHTLLEMPDDLAAQWQRTDLRADVAARTPWPVALVKDTAAACVAELVAGQGRHVKSFLYGFVDTFIGGGLVIDSHLRTGQHGNAGAIGSMPLGLAADGREPAQLLSVASLLTLERRLVAAGLDGGATADTRALLDPWWPHTRAWLDESGAAIAYSLNSAACLLDLDGAILDGSFTTELRAKLVAAVTAALDRYSWEGVVRPRVLSGTIGSDARAIGAALLPLYANFAPDRGVFLKVERLGPDDRPRPDA